MEIVSYGLLKSTMIPTPPRTVETVLALSDVLVVVIIRPRELTAAFNFMARFDWATRACLCKYFAITRSDHIASNHY